MLDGGKKKHLHCDSSPVCNHSVLNLTSLKLGLTLSFNFLFHFYIPVKFIVICWAKKGDTVWHLPRTNPINWFHFKRLFFLVASLLLKIKII